MGRQSAENRKTHTSIQGIRSSNPLKILCWTYYKTDNSLRSNNLFYNIAQNFQKKELLIPFIGVFVFLFSALCLYSYGGKTLKLNFNSFNKLITKRLHLPVRSFVPGKVPSSFRVKLPSGRCSLIYIY